MDALRRFLPKVRSLFADRLLCLKVALALALLCGMLLSAELWGSSRYYPPVPVVAGLPEIPPLLGWIWFAALLVLLAAIVVARRSRPYMLAFMMLAGLLSLWDLSRWQPWFYQYLFMLGALSLYPWGEADEGKREAALNACRLIVAGTYFWSGLQKLNAEFYEGVFPWLVGPLVALLPGFAEGPILASAVAVPFIEAAIGAGLLTRMGNWAVVLAVCMHAFILFSLGPLGHDWNSVVWPWNVAMVAFAVLLFWRTEGFSARKVLVPARSSYLHAVIVVLFAVMPAFSFFGLWDSYLSASLYSGNVEDGTLLMSEAAENRLPDGISRYAMKGPGDKYLLNISWWSINELNVPAYPEDRTFKAVARRVCSYAAPESSRVRLVIRGKPPLFGERGKETYNCSDLEAEDSRIARGG